MTPQEIIDTLEIARAEVEWEYPMNYAVAFDEAIEIIKKYSANRELVELWTGKYKKIDR
jgi:hypothetical protein